ncbi:DedA family protein [Sphingomonas changbaiensis NBRC 104936]|uniref:DedA family protein n=1 Tax=Sphingomonas changbaiensis NBRC 104936 TaxID=1219043 RepID=A0A0E9ML48_9SPHN|nr:DedA family protein [Sphingomonas changbaiensis]GAO38141.1 DedA family protein [Sphingomonas changbaiensis NBRC 104936]
MTDFILNLIAAGGYLGIFALMVIENVFPPIPSEVIMGLGGIAVARGDMSLPLLIAWATAGSTLGNLFWYWIGRRIGYERFRPFIERHGRWLTVDWPEAERLQRFFVRHGQWVVFVFRFMPTGRTLISLPAGLTYMPLRRFVLWTFLGSTIWNSVLAWAGLYFGSNFERLQHYVGPAAIAITATLLLSYLWRVVTWRPRG